MIKANQEILNDVANWSWDDTYVVADFDRTLTSSDSVTSWGLLSASNMAPKGFIEREKALYEHYRPFEIDNTIPFAEKNSLMQEWWTSLISALSEFGFSKETIDNLMSYSTLISLRKGVKELFENLSARGVPIIIVSAGLGNTISHFLENNGINYPNVFIVSNFLEYDGNTVKGIKGNIIHSQNKSEELLSDEQKEVIKERSHVILLGDQISDTYMISPEKRDSALKIAFESTPNNEAEFLEHYNIICSKDTSFLEVMEILPSFGIKRG